MIFVAGPATLVPAAYVVQRPAAVSGHGLPGPAAVEGAGPVLISERLCHPDVVVAGVGRAERPAGLALNVEYPAASDLSSAALPAFPAEQVRALFVLSAA